GLGTDGQRDIEGAPHFHSEETWRRNADDLDLVFADVERFTENGRAAAEIALPKLVADHRSGSEATAALVVVWAEKSSDGRRYSEDWKKVAAHPESIQGVRFTLRRSFQTFGCPGEDPGKRLVVFTNLLPERIG